MTPTSSRRSAPKINGRCDTCRARHVRCDQQKPRCTPCTKSHRQCEYSENAVSTNVSAAATPTATLKVVLYEPNIASLSIQRISAVPELCQSRDEARAFDFFRCKVATRLGGFFEASFWTRDVLMVGEHEAAIRYAVVALASLSEANIVASPGDALPRDGFAVRQYTKAISELKQKMRDETQPSFEVVLITCVLFICFEMCQNHYESALRQMSSGIQIFSDWRVKTSNAAQTASTLKQSSEIETQITKIYARLMLQLILFPDTHLLDSRVVKPSFTPPMPSIPPIFASVEEAKDILNGCLCTLFHGGLSAYLYIPQYSDRHWVPDHPISQINGNCLHEWSLAFEALMRLSHSQTRLSTREQQAVILLEMQYLTATILLSAGAFSPETVFDAFDAQFTKIVVMASRLTATTKQEAEPKHLSFDMGLIPPLYLTASRCRHPVIRRQAFELLREAGPRQEGVWHAGMLANVAERIVRLEESGSGVVRRSVDVPPAKRVSVVDARICSAERKVEVWCSRGRGIEEGEGEGGVQSVWCEVVEY